MDVNGAHREGCKTGKGGKVNTRIFASVLWPSKELKSLFTMLAFLSMMVI